MKKLPQLMCDFYKLSHREQYPKGITKVYSTWTPRSNKHLPQVDKVVVFGVQGFIKELKEIFQEHFFKKDKKEMVREYRRIMKNALGIEYADTGHLELLHNIGRLPLEFKSLPEGSVVDIGVPYLTIENTDPNFYWLTNYIETYASATLWKPATVASIARKYRQILEKAAKKTSDSGFLVDFQGHDFSMRGVGGLEDAARSGSGHLLSFVGTDTVPAINYLEEYYNANSDTELVGCSVPATEHSVMCAGGKDDEFETYRRLIEDVYPKGIVSIVSDTWDLWKVTDEILPRLKDKILARGAQEGINKVVIRPDSGNPADILCGKNYWAKELADSEDKGLIERLDEIFGSTVNSKGYKELNPAIGAIYGDSITLDLCQEIVDRLEKKGYASTNVVFGVGSYTYQYLTRDSLGFAMKATSVVINGKRKAIFKDPKTDDGTKKSAYGLVKVFDGPHAEYLLADERTPGFEDFPNDLIVQPEVSLAEIRKRLKETI